MHGSLLAVLVVSLLLAALARRYDVSAPLALVVAGLAATAIPGFGDIELEPELVLYVLLPPLLWSAGLESSYVGLRRNLRPIGLLAIGLPLATTFAVGFVAYKTVPEVTVAAGLTLGAIVAPPDAVSATAIGRRLGLPRRIMTLLGGESLLNDATALTAYKVALAAAIGTAASWGSGLGDVRTRGGRRGRDRRRRWASSSPSSGRGSTTRWWKARWASSHRSSSIWPPRRRTAPGCSRSWSPHSSSVSGPSMPATRPGCRTWRCGRPFSWCWSRSRS